MVSSTLPVSKPQGGAVYAARQFTDPWIQPPAVQLLRVDFGKLRPAAESSQFVVPTEVSDIESLREEIAAWQQLAAASFFAFEDKLAAE